MIERVLFKSGTKEQYENAKSLGLLKDNALYFILDEGLLYKGEVLIGVSKIENLLEDENNFIEFYGGSASEVLVL